MSETSEWRGADVFAPLKKKAKVVKVELRAQKELMVTI